MRPDDEPLIHHRQPLGKAEQHIQEGLSKLAVDEPHGVEVLADQAGEFPLRLLALPAFLDERGGPCHENLAALGGGERVKPVCFKPADDNVRGKADVPASRRVMALVMKEPDTFEPMLQSDGADPARHSKEQLVGPDVGANV